MKKKIQSIRGMHDYLPNDIYLWQHIEKILKSIIHSYGYKEIRLPILEKTVLFKKIIGNITDIVEKEMFTFLNRSHKQISLRPEGTAGCVRAMVEHGLLHNNTVQKVWYIGPMFRYERPQKGRYRQFYQLGVEVFGLSEPEIEAELILITFRFWKKLGLVKNLTLELNSIGSIETRINYCKALVSFLEKNKKFLDNDSLIRLEKNPLRILDSKNIKIQHLLNDGPILIHFLDEKDKHNFKTLCNILESFSVVYKINPRLVRGLDYYNGTVFEWVTSDLGSQNSVCAGGRYDSVVENLGGKPTPAIGFAIGLERLVLLTQTLCLDFKLKNIYVYIINLNQNNIEALFLLEIIHDFFPHVICKIEKKIKKNFFHIKTININIALFLKKNDIKKDIIVIKNLKNGTKKIVTKTTLIPSLKLFFKNVF